ncbi:MAG: transglutaminase domain-containing protein, partial [bacterium]|nr:transglutaminase domain-containing protein [bacterium]
GILATASAMLAELYRKDPRGFVMDRAVKDQLILTCRPVSILMATILKSKGISARVRSGFAPYFANYGDKSIDHWVNEYWNEKEKRWMMIDVDGAGVLEKFDPFDIPPHTFDYAADAWFISRNRQIDPHHFWNAMPGTGFMIIAWELFYDFHCLMNSEIIYPYHPRICSADIFSTLKEEELKQIDHLARLIQNPDDNFDELMQIWNTNKDFRMLKGLLLYGT